MEKVIKVTDEIHHELRKIMVSKHLATFNETIKYIIKVCDGKLYKEEKVAQ